MIDVSLSSIISSLIFSNLLLILLYFTFRRTSLLIELGYKLLAVYLIFTCIRLALPFEFFDTIAIPMPESVSKFFITIEEKLFSIFHLNIHIWEVLLIVWLTGIFYHCYKSTKSYRGFHKIILKYGINVTTNKFYSDPLHKICELYKKNSNFDIILLPGIATPMIFGINKPYILFPKDLQLEEEDIYYIMLHEVAHFYSKDLILKLMLQAICILYWWNPFVSLLKKQISTILELRIDNKVIALPDPNIKMKYLNCLLKVSKYRTSTTSEPAISFCSSNDSLLKQRFQMIMDNKTHRMKQYIFSSLIVIIYAISIVFIFEPFYISEVNQENTKALTNNTSYLIINPDGGYDFYIDNQYSGTMTYIDNSLSHLKIYATEKEVNQDE